MSSVHQDIKEWKGYLQNHYGGYCQRAREHGLVPVDYDKFKDLVEESYENCTTKKERMRYLLSKTPVKEKNYEEDKRKADAVNRAAEVLKKYFYQDGVTWRKQQTTNFQNLRDSLYTLPQESLVHILYETGIMNNLKTDAYKEMKTAVYNKALARWELSKNETAVLVNIICYQ